MKSVVRPELPTAAAGPSQAPAAAVDNSAPRSTHPEPTYKSGKTVQRTGTTSASPLACPFCEEFACGLFRSLTRKVRLHEGGPRRIL
jgi:hypothetical protein